MSGSQSIARPTVTVAALCYNHERFVETCLESIRAQTFQDFELIVIDDASTDGSRAIIERWLAAHRPDARYLPQRTNQGICRVLNMVLREARGEILALASTDDLWEPTKLAQHLSVFSNASDDVAVVYSDATRIDVDGNPIAGNFIETYLRNAAPPSGDILNVLATQNFIPAMAATLRIDALRAVGGYDESLAFEDYDMWLRLANRYRFVFVPGTLARYRVVPGSLGDELFVRRKRTVAATHCRMALKLLRNPRLGSEQRAIWTDQLLRDTALLFDTDAPEAPHFLRVVARITRGRRWIALAVLASVGVTRTRLDRLRKALRLSSWRQLGA